MDTIMVLSWYRDKLTGETAMAALLIKSVPPEIHQRLRLQAERHHRSMNREVLAILEERLATPSVTNLPPPVKTLRPISGATITGIIRRMRDQIR
ncbi:MAG: Arc family DNA-binding protein [Kiritimatiellaeota bacterium]|nr:Arc family DNA-binding protein [Kiritimatiellota bacterium]